MAAVTELKKSVYQLPAKARGLVERLLEQMKKRGLKEGESWSIFLTPSDFNELAPHTNSYTSGVEAIQLQNTEGALLIIKPVPLRVTHSVSADLQTT